jgi:hypothetical protein
MTRSPTAAPAGTSSRANSNRFGPSKFTRQVAPVMLAPGRARLETRPRRTGSPPIENTIGIVAVAAFAESGARGLASQGCAPLCDRPVPTPWRAGGRTDHPPTGTRIQPRDPRTALPLQGPVQSQQSGLPRGPYRSEARRLELAIERASPAGACESRARQCDKATSVSRQSAGATVNIAGLRGGEQGAVDGTRRRHTHAASRSEVQQKLSNPAAGSYQIPR